MNQPPATPPAKQPLALLGVLLGATLIIAGVFLVLVQFSGFAAVFRWWPLLVTAPGVLLLAAAFSVPRGRGISYLAVPGMMVLSTGLVLLAQSLSRDWQSWAYAWALIVPTSVGLGLLIAGSRERAPRVTLVGGILLGVGTALFVLAEWFFVRVLGVGGPGLGEWFGPAMPTLLVVFGALLVLLGLRRGR